MGGSWIVGVLINICGACTTNLGTVLMKYHSEKKGVGMSKKLGIFLFCLGTCLTFGSFAFAAQSLLAGVSAVQFVSNLFFSNWLLGEPFSKKNITGTAVLIGGIALLVVSAEKQNPGSLDADAIFAEFFFDARHFKFLMSLLSAVAVLSIIFWFRTGISPFWRKAKSEKVIKTELSLPRSQQLLGRLGLPTMYVAISAMVGGQSVVSGKVLSMILKDVFIHKHASELIEAKTFLVIILWILCAVVWVTNLNRALRVFYGVFIIPLTQVNWTLWTMISGGVVYREFDRMSTRNLLLFLLGAFVLFAGVSLLAPNRKEAERKRSEEQLAEMRAKAAAANGMARKPSLPPSSTIANPVFDADQPEVGDAIAPLAKTSSGVLPSDTTEEDDAFDTPSGLNSSRKLKPASTFTRLGYDRWDVKDSEEEEGLNIDEVYSEVSAALSVSCATEQLTGHISHTDDVHIIVDNTEEEPIRDPPFFRLRRYLKGRFLLSYGSQRSMESIAELTDNLAGPGSSRGGPSAAGNMEMVSVDLDEDEEGSGSVGDDVDASSPLAAPFSKSVLAVRSPGRSPAK
eukprot:jgi/Mesvir1/23166/Mv22639-RA.1